MNQPMQQPPNPAPFAGPTLEEKKAFVAGLMSFPALTVLPFSRRKVGFRNLKPSRVIVLTIIMLAVGYYVRPDSPTESGAFSIAPGGRSLAQSNIPDGFDSAPPSDWLRLSPGARAEWLNKHRLTPEQERARRLQMQAEAQRAAQWAQFKNSLSGWLMYGFALAFLGVGLFQRRARWNDLLDGVKWHTRSRGVPYLKRLLGRLMPETHIVRFADPAAVFLTGLAVLIFSRALGLWLVFSAFALYIVEQVIYETELDKELDMLDTLVNAETVTENLRHWKKGESGPAKGGSSIEESGGVLSTSASIPDLVARRENREKR